MSKPLDMLTNHDAQKIVDSNAYLREVLDSMEDPQPGSGYIEIHKYAVKIILQELLYCRTH